MTGTPTIACPGCGARVPDIDGPTHAYMGASAGCWAIYTEVLAREYENVAYFAVHQFTVDAYAVQHPGQPERRTIQSVAVHLISLYHTLELGYDFQKAQRAMQRATRSKAHLTWLEPPASLGEVTVLDVHAAEDVIQHREVVRRWAESAWQAWSPHHETIRAWTAML